MNRSSLILFYCFFFESSDCPPSLTGVRDEDEVYITVCAENEEEGDEFEFEIEFESDPKPDKITWFMQDAVGRRETVKEVSKYTRL